MKKLVLTGLACAGLIMALPEPGYAHGGQYRGPGDVVPPNPGGGGGRTPGPRGPNTPGPGGPTTPGPAGPSSPGPAGPTSGGPAAPGAAAGPRTGPRGAQIGPDLAQWQFWWEFNKDPFINLKAAIHAGEITTGSAEFFMGGSRRPEAMNKMKPTPSEILGRILPALKRALDSSEERNIVSSCLVAMGKIGKDHETFSILPIMKAKLMLPDQEVQETAAVSMGISQMPDALQYLIPLAKDTPAGRKLTPGGNINSRTRAFACYGIGLVGWASSDPDLKRQCYDALAATLTETTKGGVTDRNVPVAAINALRLLRPNPQGSEKDKALLDDALKLLTTYYKKDAGRGEDLIQSHCSTAIAQLIGRGNDTDGTYKEMFAGELGGNKKRSIWISQSAAMALGILCQPQEDNKADKKYSDLLVNYSTKGKDEQTRYFSLIALAKIGGNSNRNELMKTLAKGSKALVKPWAALSLGILAHNAAKAAGEGAVVDAEIGRVLHKELMSLKTSQTQSAISVALGLCKYREAADDLEQLLQKYRQRGPFAGYLCIGLALMGNTRSTELIRSIVKGAVRRPELLSQASIALGKLGDKRVTEDLQDMLLNDPGQNLAKLSAIASALGFIGDRRTIDPLTKMLHNESITNISRAFAAVALGGVADKEPLVWNSKIAVNMNYRAAVETLTNGQSGILDIL